MLSRYRLDPATGVFHPQQAKSFAYSEPGEAEEEILRKVRGARDRSSFSPELIALITDWSSFYHFTPKRANLMRPLRTLLSGDVLEVGAGCGAITRYLGEVARSVTAVEGSPRRAAIARERCRDLAGVEVYCDNIQSFEAQRKFDTVTCIGVLEYGNVFMEGPNGIAQMLRVMRGHLAEGGRLVIAIENRLGLKYFAGSPEDHLDIPYYGIQDLYSPHTAVTFGRLELQKLLASEGLAVSTTLYPFPDYKQPDTIFSGEAFALDDFPFGGVLTGFEASAQDRGAARAFSETLAWPAVAANGLAADLANSFLVIAQRDDDPAPAWQPEALVHKYSTLRLKQHARELRIIRQDSSFAVRRRHLFPDAGDPSNETDGWSEEEFIPGALLTAELPRILARPQWTLRQLERWARPWMELLRNASAADGTLPPEYVDCAPFNVIRRPDGALQPFDLEWRAEGRAPLDWIAFRGLFHSLDRNGRCAPAADLPAPEIAALAFALLERFGLPTGAERREEILLLEARFIHSVTGTGVERFAAALGAKRLPVEQPGGPAAGAPYLCRLCWTSTPGRLETGPKQAVTLRSGASPQLASIPIPALPPGEFELFLMPADRKGVMRIWGMTLTDEQERPLWSWNPARQPELPVQMTSSRLLPALDDEPGRLLHLYSDASSLLLPIPPGLLRGGDGGRRLEVILSWMDPLQHLERIFELMPAHT